MQGKLSGVALREKREKIRNEWVLCDQVAQPCSMGVVQLKGVGQKLRKSGKSCSGEAENHATEDDCPGRGSKGGVSRAVQTPGVQPLPMFPRRTIYEP